MLYIDIETSTPDPAKPDLSLDTRLNIIDLIGYTYDHTPIITVVKGHDINHIEKHLLGNFDDFYCGHNFKFDFKSLWFKGIKLSVDFYAHDTLVMATASIVKVPDDYLEQYEAKRREINKILPKGQSHRQAKKHSLKILAPYFLGVSPFWENTETHNDEEYLKKDVEYTKGLSDHFIPMLKKDGVWQFYEEKLMPWQRMILKAELSGIHVDLKEMQTLKDQAEAGVLNSLKKLRAAWSKVEEEYAYKQKNEIQTKYEQMAIAACQKVKPTKNLEKDLEKKTKVAQRYKDLETKAIAKIEPFNYASPSQLLWAFKDVLKYPVTNMEGDETTGASVLEMLAGQGKEDIKALLEYKENYKLVHSYFPSYAELTVNGRINCSFNIHGTRTGRLSCSDPNLQQIPPMLKKLFKPAEGNSFVSQDLSAIEPVLIAYYTEDPTLCEIFIKGLDFHGYAATALFPSAGLLPESAKPQDIKKLYPDLRQAAKQGDLSLFYGSGKNRLFTTLTLHGLKVTEEQCQRMVKSFKETFKESFFFKQMIDAELSGGNYVENLFGRRYVIENPEDVYMKGFNTLIQGSASDLLLQGTYDCLKELKEDKVWAELRLLVHDNAVLECKDKDAQYVYDRLAYHLTKFKLKTKHGLIPLKIEGVHGKTWKC